MPKDRTTAAPAKKTARKRPGRKPRELPTWYVVAVESWEWSYSFGIQRMKDRPEPYDDYRHLHLTGTLLRPAKLKVETVRLIFLPDEAYNRDKWDRHKRPHVGSVSLHRGRFEALCSMPANALAPILTMLAADKIKYAVLDGAKLRYGHADITHYRLDMSMDEDDLPPDS